MTTMTDTMLCEDCEEHRKYLARKYVVDNCREDASQPGMCLIDYRRKDTAAAVEAPVPSTAKASPAAKKVAPMGAVAAPAKTKVGAAQAPATTAAALDAGADGADMHAGPALPLQAAAAKAIVNLFETGEVLGDYGAVAILPGDTGHLTYGRSQTTLGSGNLARLLGMYCGQPGARFGARLAAWLPAVRKRDNALDQDYRLHNVLRACADDPLMRDVQDRFFDEAYWERALDSASVEGITLPLGVAVVYDSWVHGSWKAMRDRTNASGSVAADGQEAWLARYVRTRRNWLANHDNPLLRKTVYRMDAFQRLMEQGYWGLQLPLVVRGKEISLATLSAPPTGCYDGPQPGTRALAVQLPFVRGLDVRLLQLGLSDREYDICADGIFGNTSSTLVRQFQKAEGLPVTGVADPLLVSRLAN